MRSLKFRFWNALTGKYEEYSDLFFIRGDGVICSNDSVENNLEAEQYTDLKDKNGKEIYEGDILRDVCDEEVWNCKVEYDNNYAQFYCDSNRSECWSFEDAKYDELEVIGNIHENPELLDKR